jgi:hypothetical protein
MCNQTFITPTLAVTGDTTPFMNVQTTTPGGEVQIVTTGGTVNTIAPERHIVLGDMLVSPGHYRTIPTDLYVDGDLTIQKEDDVVIGDKTVSYEGRLSIDGEMVVTGDIDIQGDLIFDDGGPGTDDGIKAGNADFTGWIPIEGGTWTGLFYKQITFRTPFSDTNYAISLTAINYPGAGGGVGYLLVIDKLDTGFKIYTKPAPPDLASVDWLAVKY